MTSCRWESDVLRAASENRWPDNLRRHLGECDDCMATAAVAPWMSTFAGMSDREHILPDPSILWLKAKLLQGTVDAAKAAQPLNVVQIVAYLVVASGWAAVMTWKWDAVQVWMRSFSPTAVVTAGSSAQSLSMSFFAMIFVLASMTVMLALHTIMAED